MNKDVSLASFDCLLIFRVRGLSSRLISRTLAPEFRQKLQVPSTCAKRNDMCPRLMLGMVTENGVLPIGLLS
jgi:hypothetical protein